MESAFKKTKKEQNGIESNLHNETKRWSLISKKSYWSVAREAAVAQVLR